MRKIEPKMVKFLDEKLAKNGLAQAAIAKNDARTIFRLALEACVGIRESGGNNEGPLVDLIQETVGGQGVEPWCMSFIQTGIAYAELKTGFKSPVVATEHCMTAWATTPKTQRVRKVPAPGAIIIWQKGSTSSGHTGIVVEYDHERKKMKCIEGNTEAGLNNGKVERDGGGVYLTERSAVQNGNMRVVGFLKPF